MKSLILVLLGLLYSASAVLAQQPKVSELDSLLGVLKQTREDTVKVRLLIGIAAQYAATDYEKSVTYLKQAIRLAQKAQQPSLVSLANYKLGNIFLEHSRLNEALDCFEITLEISTELGDKETRAFALNNMADIYQDFGKHPLAISTHLKALKLFEVIGNSKGIANTLINVGNTYLLTGDLKQAGDYYQKALTRYVKVGDKRGQALAYNNLGNVVAQNGDIAKAMDFFNRALFIYQQESNQQGLVMAIGNVVNCHIYFKQYDSALVKSYHALELARQYDLRENLGFVYTALGEIYHELASDEKSAAAIRMNTEEAKGNAYRYTDSARQVFTSLGLISEKAESLEALSRRAASQGNYREAYERYLEYVTIKDSIFNTEVDKKITRSAMQYEFDKKEAAQKAEQEKKDITQRNILYSVVSGLIGTLLFLGIVFRQRNRIKKEKQRSDELLLNILPAEVAEELKETGSAAAKQFDQVTVMFTDFKGFTQISEKLSPAQLVAEIDDCFKAFDHILSVYPIEKIKTIGDAYMCVGGLPVANTTHATDVVKAAIDIQRFMQQHMQQRQAQGKEVFEIRIGIHTGPVVAGIVGVKKFAYDVWGDTVNIASRMESSGEPGKINISASTYALVRDTFPCVYRGKIQAKNKGEIDMYFVEAPSGMPQTI